MSSQDLRAKVYLLDAQLTKRAEHSLRAFVEQAWPVLEPTTPFLPNWHIDLICEYLEAVTAGTITRLLINVPPRSMKSLLVSILWPAWEWLQEPSRRWIFASYAESLANKLSLDRRTLLQSAWYQQRWGDRVQLAADQNEKGEFMNTARGHMIATSITGSVLGKGGDRIVIDDPHNPTQIESDAQRDLANTGFRQSLATRLNNKKTGAIVVVMQRLHERDLAALVQELGFETLCIPAEAETRLTHTFPQSSRSFVREPGDLLWPARDGRAELDEQKRLLGSEAYAAQYQQRPMAVGGALFKREWFRFYDVLPEGQPEWIASWDMTFKDAATSDYVVGLQAVRFGANIYIVDRIKGRWAFVETCHQVRRLRERYPYTRTVLIEDAANGPAIINALQQHVPGILAVRPSGSKYARAQAATPILEAGQVYLPNPRPRGQLDPGRAWVEDFIDQCCGFPQATHDDDVDALTQLVARCVERIEASKYFTGLVW